MKRSSVKCISAFRTRIYFVLCLLQQYEVHFNNSIRNKRKLFTSFWTVFKIFDLWSNRNIGRNNLKLLNHRYCFIFTSCYKDGPIVIMRLLICLRNSYHIFARMLSVSDVIILILKLLSTHGVLNMLFMPQKEEHFWIIH